LVIIIPELGVPRELINFSFRGFQGLLSSLFSPIKFTSRVSLGIPSVFQGDVPLLGVLLSVIFDFLEVIGGIQSLALVNFRVSFDSLKSSFFGNMVYIEINLATSPDESALSNPFIFWISIPIKITAPHSDTIRGILYTKVVKSSFIISTIPSVRLFSSFNITKTYFSNTIILVV